METVTVFAYNKDSNRQMVTKCDADMAEKTARYYRGIKENSFKVYTNVRVFDDFGEFCEFLDAMAAERCRILRESLRAGC